MENQQSVKLQEPELNAIWAKKVKKGKKGKKGNLDFKSALEVGVRLFIEQTNWFLRHEQNTIRSFAAFLTAELAISGLVFSEQFSSGNRFNLIAAASLFMIAILSIVIAGNGIQSCKRSYLASIEQAILKAKSLWAMGLTSVVSIDDKVVDLSNCPMPQDPTLYVPRHLHIYKPETETGSGKRRRLKKMEVYVDTKTYTEDHIKSSGNTFFYAKIKIWLFSAFSFLLGTGSAILVLVHHFSPAN